jgi:hypothetical protein
MLCARGQGFLDTTEASQARGGTTALTESMVTVEFKPHGSIATAFHNFLPVTGSLWSRVL